MQVREIDILPFNWNGIYFHGTAQTLDDRVSGDTDIAKIKDGVYIVEKEDKKLLFFKWKRIETNVHRGLIVDPSSIKDLEYAVKCFMEKTKFL